MIDQDRLDRISALLDEKGYAAATIAELGDSVARAIAFCASFATERYEDSEADRVMYVFPDDTTLVITSGVEVTIG